VLTMSMGRKKRAQQASMFVAKSAALRGPRHRFYEALEKLLRAAGFDCQVEALCSAYYEKDGTLGRHSIPPGVYFRMLLIGFFEGIEAERGICWRCEDSLSLRSFLGLELDERVPDHSTLSRTRDRLPTKVYEAVFDLVLGIVDEHGLLNGKVAGVDSTYLRADASMKSIVRRDTGDGYNAYLARLANDAGIKDPTVEDLRRMDRTRKGKRTSNKDWESPVDGDARIARMKDGTTRLAHKAEHVVDMQSGVVVHADILDATTGDASSIVDSVGKADERLSHVRDDDDDAPGASSADDPRPTKHIKEVCGDKGYHKAITIRELQRRGVRTYIPERKQRGQRRFTDKGGWFTARAVYANRARVNRSKGKALQRKRGELIERSFAHTLETGGHRRVRLRGRANIAKRYLVHVAGFNLSVVLRKLLGFGTPRGFAGARKGLFAVLFVLWASIRAVSVALLRQRHSRRSATAMPQDDIHQRVWWNAGLLEPVSSTGC
jgi:transposase